MPRDQDIAWAAGLFEGEGCITDNKVVSKGRTYVRPRLQLRSTDKDVVQKFHRIVGCGTVIQIKNPAHIAAGRKPAWDWRVGAKKDVRAVLVLLSPFFGKRRQQRAALALSTYKED